MAIPLLLSAAKGIGGQIVKSQGKKIVAKKILGKKGKKEGQGKGKRSGGNKSSAIVPVTQRGSAITASNFASDTGAKKASASRNQNPYITIIKELRSIEKILKKSLISDKKYKKTKMRMLEKQKRADREKKREKKKGKLGGILAGKLGLKKIQSSIGDFIFNILLGKLVLFLIDNYETIEKVLGFLGGAFDFLTKAAGAAFDGIVSIIDGAYNINEWVREKIEDIGGENLKAIYDKFTSRFAEVASLSIAIMALATRLNPKGNIPKNPPKPPKPPKPTVKPKAKAPTKVPTKAPTKAPVKPKVQTPVKTPVTAGGGGQKPTKPTGTEAARKALEETLERGTATKVPPGTAASPFLPKIKGVSDPVLAGKILMNKQYNDDFMKFLQNNKELAKRGYGLKNLKDIKDFIIVTGYKGITDPDVIIGDDMLGAIQSQLKGYRQYRNILNRQIRLSQLFKNRTAQKPAMLKKGPGIGGTLKGAATGLMNLGVGVLAEVLLEEALSAGDRASMNGYAMNYFDLTEENRRKYIKGQIELIEKERAYQESPMFQLDRITSFMSRSTMSEYKMKMMKGTIRRIIEIATERGIALEISQTQVNNIFKEEFEAQRKAEEQQRELRRRAADAANRPLPGPQDPLIPASNTTTYSGPPINPTMVTGNVLDTELRTGPAGRIGVGTEYHIDTKFHKGLSMSQIVGMMDELALGYRKRGREIEFSNDAVAGIIYNPDASMTEKQKLMQRVFAAHSHSMHADFHSIDYYVPHIGKGRRDKSAEGVNILTPTVRGGRVNYGTGGGWGASVTVTDAAGNIISKTGHGDMRSAKSGSISIPQDPAQKPVSKEPALKPDAELMSNLGTQKSKLNSDALMAQADYEKEGLQVITLLQPIHILKESETPQERLSFPSLYT